LYCIVLTRTQKHQLAGNADRLALHYIVLKLSFASKWQVCAENHILRNLKKARFGAALRVCKRATVQTVAILGKNCSVAELRCEHDFPIVESTFCRLVF